MTLLRNLWAFRGFILGSVRREIQAKYRNSLFGFAWMILQPLSLILVYTVIFSKLMHSRLPGVEGTFAYSIYLCSGIVAWGLFAEITGRSINVFIDNANLIKKLNFPRLCLPTIIVLSALFNFCILLGLFLLFLLLTGNLPGWTAFSLLPVLAVQIAFSVGLGMTLGVLNVFFRDVGQLFAVGLQLWFWFTPIVYPASILPAWVRDLLQFNPMATLVEAYQGAFVSGTSPDWSRLWPVALAALALCLYSVRLFSRHVGDMVDEL